MRWGDSTRFPALHRLGSPADQVHYPCLERGKEKFHLIEVIVQSNESIDSALKRFNQRIQQSGVLRQLKEHMHYEKPSDKRRRMRRRSRIRK